MAPRKLLGPRHGRLASGSDYFDYTDKQGDNTVLTATGWQTPARTYAFIYVPVVPGDVAIVPDKNALDQKAGN